mgnify:CR=1 FL=1
MSSAAVADTIDLPDQRLQLTLGVRRQLVESNNYSATTGARTTHYKQGALTRLAGIGLAVVKEIAERGAGSLLLVAPFLASSQTETLRLVLHEEPVAPRKKSAEISKAANDLVLTMMAKDKEDRYQTPTELLDEGCGKPSGSSNSFRLSILIFVREQELKRPLGGDFFSWTSSRRSRCVLRLAMRQPCGPP